MEAGKDDGIAGGDGIGGGDAVEVDDDEGETVLNGWVLLLWSALHCLEWTGDCDVMDANVDGRWRVGIRG